MTVLADAEQEAIVADAELRRRELVPVIRALWADRGDEDVLTELLDLFGRLRAAEDVLKGRTSDQQ